jgi:CSLREA domain-containing protein
LFLNADGTVTADQKISDTTGLTATLDNSDLFGVSVSGIGDLDSDGINDMAVGAEWDDDGGTDRGAVYVLFLNANGTVKAEQKISDTTGGLTATLDDSDYFGNDVAGIGDVNGDGVSDLAVTAVFDDDGGGDRGGVHLLFLNANGTVKAEQKISDTSGGLTATLDDDDRFGISAAGIGDLDGDGRIDLAVGAHLDDDGGTDRGAVYVLHLAPPLGPIVVNSTGDGTDNNAGDGVCDTGGTNSQGATECTLRAAIAEANALAGDDVINFNMPATEPGHSGGVWTIAPGSALPGISTTLTLDASTQPGHAANSTLFPNPMDSSIAVRLTGASAPVDTGGLAVLAGSVGTKIRGLSITGFTGSSAEAVGLSGAVDTVIAGNHLGVAPDGITVDANNTAVAVYANSTGTIIGGPLPQDRNMISGNAYAGVSISATTATGTVIQGNEIGVLGDGSLSGNDIAVIATNDSTGTVIGGDQPGEGNRIAGSTFLGVQIGSGNSSTSASILGNHTWSNTGLGIDLKNPNGVNPNDSGDGDSGANDLLNFPVITSATESSGTVTVDFDLDVPDGSYRVEFFTNPSGADPSGYGEGEVFAGSVDVSVTGGIPTPASTTFSGSGGDVVTATATQGTAAPFGPTSEFASATTVTTAAFVVNSTGDASDSNPGDASCDTGGTNSQGATECTLRAAIEEANALAPPSQNP